MKRFILVAMVALVTVSLAGCSTNSAPGNDTGKTPDAAPIVATSEPDASPTPTPTADAEFGEQVINDRGNLVKSIGQLAGTGLSNDPDTLGSRFVVTDIVVDPVCTSGWADAPTNGHFVAIHMNVESTPELAGDPYPSLSFNSWGWQAYDETGKRVNDPQGAAYSCMTSADELPSDIGPGQSVSGFIVLDVPSAHGSVVLTMGGPTGWEWTF